MACYGCKESLQEEWALRAGGKFLFHAKCFRCADCKKDLATVPIGSVDEIRCSECHGRKVPITCFVCQQVVEAQFYKRVDGRTYHCGCLICEGCRHPFGEDEKQCYPVDGKYYCLNCHYVERSAKYLREPGNLSV